MTNRLALLAAVCCLISFGALGATWYVDKGNTSGVEDGTTWGTAFVTVQEGIDAAGDGDEVWVAAATYDEGRAHSTGAVIMKEGVGLYGGFTGAETEREDRDWQANVTTLDGSTARGGAAACHVVIGANDAVLDGFTIIGGNANGVYEYANGGGMYNCFAAPAVANCAFVGNTAAACGGGMYNYHLAPTITNCTFSGNSARDGGGMYNHLCPASVTNCTFSDNSATDQGGAMANKACVAIVVAGCTFSSNSAQDGAGMHNSNHSSATLVNCTFDGNTAAGTGGGMTNRGGSNGTVDTCVFSSNTAPEGGGGMLNHSSSPKLTNCTFSGNSATTGDGGGLCNVHSWPWLRACVFSDNSASNGGGISNDDSSPLVMDCLFTGNTADQHGGGAYYGSTSWPTLGNCIFWANETQDGHGAGIANCGEYEAILTNCTFNGNTASGDGQGGAVYTGADAAARITNCILWGDSAGGAPNEIANAVPGTATATNSDVQGGYPGSGNINEDPDFHDALSGDLMLNAGSECIDAGTATGAPATDIRGVGRPKPPGGAVDMGAYEYGTGEPIAQFTAAPTSGRASLLVSFADLSLPGSAPITDWLWDFGDTATSTDQHPNHTYTQAGVYSVALTVTTADGADTATETAYITVDGGPVAAFTAEPNSGAPPLTVQFTDASEAGVSPITDWHWDFGDGDTSDEPNPQHEYTDPGLRTVSLTVTTDAGNDTTSDLINIGGPTPGFLADVTFGYEALTVQFADASEPGVSPITDWRWDFGDDGISDEPNPSHLYAGPGVYTVSLTVTTAVGSVTEVKERLIRVYRLFYADKANASGIEDGTSWATAFTELQDAVDAAHAAGPGEIWVAAGVYDEARADASGALVLREGVHLYGGFDKSEVGRDDRSWADNVTTIDGATSRAGAQAYHVVLGADEATLDGFTVTGGKANDGDDLSMSPEDCGGGMFNSGVSPTVANCTFTDNEAYEGGGMLNDHAAPTVSNCTFLGNDADLDGGGMNNYYSTPTVTGCTFEGNTVNLYGGGVYNENCSPTFADCLFTTNTANYGGGMLDYYSWPTLTGCTFSDNTAGYGAGMYNEVSPATLTDCTFADNAAPDTGGWGGGLFNFDRSSTRLGDCVFAGNSADTGGALYNYDLSSAVVTNCTFRDNSASSNGGAIFNGSSWPTVIHSTFYGNSAAAGGGLFNYDCISPPTVTNCILWNDTPNEIRDLGGSAAQVTYSDVKGWPVRPGAGNINTDPDFVDAPGGDLRLEENSPCVDHGTSTSVPPPGVPPRDLAGIPRPQGAEVDMGAYEYGVAPTAAFSADPVSGVNPLTVTFTDESDPGSSPITRWSWDFDNDGIEDSAEQHPTHEYTAWGKYTVSLTVTNGAGSDTHVEVDCINVSSGPTADFTAAPTWGVAPLIVDFTDTSLAGSSPIAAWSWDFNNDGTEDSAEQHPSHMFGEGVFTVSLTVTDQDEQTDTKVITDLLTVEVAPVAGFAAVPTAGYAPLTVNFIDESAPGSEPILTWEWDFGDGSPVSAEQHPVHIYEIAASYTVSLTVTTVVSSDTHTETDYIVVDAGIAPTAAFAADQTSGLHPLTVQFTDASAPGSSPITAWAWDFGDDATSEAQNPSHVYDAPGLYTVSLTVTSEVGTNTETKTDYIEVLPGTAPNAAFSAEPTSGTRPLAVQFTDESAPGTSPITLWVWDFGDDTTSEEQNPNHVYDTAGLFTVSLTVTSDVGSDTETKTGYVEVLAGTGPNAAFSASPTLGPRPLSVQFTDESTPGSSAITGWAWDFGDDATSDEQHPSHTYEEAGLYTVSLTVTTADGDDTETKEHYVDVLLVVYVDKDNASGTEDGASWATAFTEIQAGVDAALAAGGGEVWVAQGNYGERRSNTTGSLLMAQDVHLYGGFAGGESALEQRNWFDNVTVIDGTTARNGSRAYHVVIGADDATLDGFTVTGGRANNAISSRDRGGGMYNDGASPTVANCVFEDNSANYRGGGMYNGDSASPALTNCKFIGNSAAGALFSQGCGGGMSNTGNSSPVLTNCVFHDNAAHPAMFSDGCGGAMYNADAAPVLTNCTFYANTAHGAFLSDGDGGALYNQASSPVMTNCILWGDSPNEIDNNGGGSAIVNYSDVQGGYGSGTGNIEAAPLFANPAAGDLSVQALSPCVDAATQAGAPDSDICAVPRPQGDGVDMGAYEFWAGPAADFNASETAGYAPFVVDFTDLSAPGTSPITSWAWDFGDDETSEEQNPAHSYTDAGTYSVALTVATAVGTGTETKTDYIMVDLAIGPTAAFSADATSGAYPLTVQFTDLSAAGTSEIIAWQWDFGDGKQGSQEQSPLHVYTAPGSFPVSLTVTTVVGSDTETKEDHITVYAPVPWAGGAGTAALAGLCLAFGVAVIRRRRARQRPRLRHLRN